MNISRRYLACLESAFEDVVLKSGCLYDMNFSDTAHSRIHSYKAMVRGWPDSIQSGALSLGERIINNPAWHEDIRKLARKSFDEQTPAIEPFASWRDVPAWYLEQHYCGIFFLDTDSFRYYIAAFIKEYLLNHAGFRENGMAIDTWISILSPDESTNRQYWIQIYSLLNKPQKRLVSRFLHHLSRDEREPPDTREAAGKALDSFWRSHSRT